MGYGDVLYGVSGQSQCGSASFVWLSSGDVWQSGFGDFWHVALR